MNSVQKAIDGLRQGRTQLADELGRIDAALSALEGHRASAKPARAKKPCCTKGEVVEIVAGLLADNGSLSQAELDGLAKEKISAELGKNLSGFAMRLREALQDPQFKEFAPGQYRMCDEPDAG